MTTIVKKGVRFRGRLSAESVRVREQAAAAGAAEVAQGRKGIAQDAGHPPVR